MIQSGRRREELTRKIAIKASKSERFSKWFEVKDYLGLNIREKNRKNVEVLLKAKHVRCLASSLDSSAGIA